MRLKELYMYCVDSSLAPLLCAYIGMIIMECQVKSQWHAEEKTNKHTKVNKKYMWAEWKKIFQPCLHSTLHLFAEIHNSEFSNLTQKKIVNECMLKIFILLDHIF